MPTLLLRKAQLLCLTNAVLLGGEKVRQGVPAALPRLHQVSIKHRAIVNINEIKTS